MDTESEPERGMDELPGGIQEDGEESKESYPASDLKNNTFEDSRGGDWEEILGEEQDEDDVKRSIGLRTKYHP